MAGASVTTFEEDPAAGDCQRWAGRRHSFRPRHEGGFDQDRYAVRLIRREVAERYVETHHYAGRCSSVLRVGRWGLFDRRGTPAHGVVDTKRYLDPRSPFEDGDGRSPGSLVGVCIYGVSQQARVMTNVFPTLAPYTESVELSRLVLADEVPANGESWFVHQTFERIGALGVRGVVTFADPMVRTTVDGDIVKPGHVGCLYQALNAVVLGRSAARKVWLLPDGTIFGSRTMQKALGGEQGAAYSARTLQRFGAPPPRPGEDLGAWVRTWRQRVCRRANHRGNWRYGFRVTDPGMDRRERRALCASIPMLTPSPRYRNPKVADDRLDEIAAALRGRSLALATVAAWEMRIAPTGDPTALEREIVDAYRLHIADDDMVAA